MSINMDYHCPMSNGIGPTNEPRCPKCNNSFQNGIPDGEVSFRCCATCKTIFSITTEQYVILGLMEENRKLRGKLGNMNRGSLANNLCPDHRDKQSGKSCLACKIERLTKICEQARDYLKNCSYIEKTSGHCYPDFSVLEETS